MMHTFMTDAPRLMQAFSWSLLHSLWQGALIWLLLLAIFRAFPAMSARLKHGCALMAMALLVLWVANTAASQWQQLHTISVRVTPGNAEANTGYVIEAPATPPGWNSAMSAMLPQPGAIMPWLMLCYGAGLLLMTLRFGRGLAQLRFLRRCSILPEVQLLNMVHSLQLQLGITQQVLVRLSTRVAAPVVIGALRPLILLPVTMVEELGAAGLEAILLHELAHISRADFLINIFQSLTETVLFFNPFVWRISAVLRREREHCCDDLVVAHTRQPMAYARALASLAKQQGAAMPGAALAATGQQSHLLNRIKRIVEMKNQPVRYGHIIAACSFAALIITVSIVYFSPSFAQQSRKDKDIRKQQQSERAASPAANTSFADSNSIRYRHSRNNAMSLREQSAVEDALQSAQSAFKHMPEVQAEVQQALRNIGDMHLDSITASAMKIAGQALQAVDWNMIHQQVDSALQQVAAIDWPAINREIAAGLAEADRAMSDPKLKAEWRQGMAEARRAVAVANKDAARVRHYDTEQIRREMEEDRRDLEQDRKGIEEDRKEMEEERRAMEKERKAMEQSKEELKPLRPMKPLKPLKPLTPLK